MTFVNWPSLKILVSSAKKQNKGRERNTFSPRINSDESSGSGFGEIQVFILKSGNRGFGEAVRKQQLVNECFRSKIFDETLEVIFYLSYIHRKATSIA